MSAINNEVIHLLVTVNISFIFVVVFHFEIITAVIFLTASSHDYAHK